MNIDEAVIKLEEILGDPEVFQVYKSNDGKTLIVRVVFIYRVNEVPKEFEGFPISLGRISCW